MRTSAALKPLWAAVFDTIGDPLNVSGVGDVAVAETADPATTKPYITFSIAAADHGRATGEFVLQTDVWVSDLDVQPVIDIQDALSSILDGAILTWEGGTAQVFLASTPAIGRDPDEPTRHGVQIYRVLVHT